MKKPLRQNVFSYAYLAGQNVLLKVRNILLKVRNTSAINMGPNQYDTLIDICANYLNTDA